MHLVGRRTSVNVYLFQSVHFCEGKGGGEMGIRGTAKECALNPALLGAVEHGAPMLFSRSKADLL